MKIKRVNLLSCYVFSEVCNARTFLEDGLWLIYTCQSVKFWNMWFLCNAICIKIGKRFSPKNYCQIFEVKKVCSSATVAQAFVAKFNFCCKFGQCNSKNDMLSIKSTINIEIHVPWWLQCIVHLIFVIFRLKSVNSEKEYNSERILNRFTSTVWNFGG